MAALRFKFGSGGIRPKFEVLGRFLISRKIGVVMTPSKSHILQMKTSSITYSNFRFRLRPICRGRPVEVVENVHAMYRQIYGGFVSDVMVRQQSMRRKTRSEIFLFEYCVIADHVIGMKLHM